MFTFFKVWTKYSQKLPQKAQNDVDLEMTPDFTKSENIFCAFYRTEKFLLIWALTQFC